MDNPEILAALSIQDTQQDSNKTGVLLQRNGWKTNQTS